LDFLVRIYSQCPLNFCLYISNTSFYFVRSFFIGTGFSVRDRTAHDVDDELDIEGSDEEVFGHAQFTEGDILPLQPDDDIDIEDNDNGDDHGLSAPGPSTTRTIPSASVRGKSLRDLVAAGKVTRRHNNINTWDKIAAEEAHRDIDESIRAAQTSGDTDVLVRALEHKIKVLVSCAYLWRIS
jgi:E3 ubiquitin-protein ligase RNF220